MKDRNSHNLPLLVPVGLFLVALAAYGFRDRWLDQLVGLYPDKISLFYTVTKSLQALVLALACWTILACSTAFLWRRLEVRNGRAVPRLLTGLYTFSFITLTAMAMLIVVLEQGMIEVSGIVVTLIVIVLIFFRSLLTDLMAGLSINLDSSMTIGDTIALQDGEPGILTEVTWRSTHLKANDHSLIVIPNNLFATSTVINYSSFDNIRPVKMSLILDPALPVKRVLRILGAVIRSAQEEGYIAADPAGIANAVDFADYGIRYQLKVFYSEKRQTEPTVRTALVERIANHFDKAGVQFSIPKQQLVSADSAELHRDWTHAPHLHKLLGGFDLFQPLDDQELRQLCEHLIVHKVSAGSVIIEQNSDGSTMYGLAEGYLEVSISTENESKLVVGSLSPGQFFGEMSLLVGESRAATVTALVDAVVFEITREVFHELITNRPEIANMISLVVAERQLASTMAIESSEYDKQEAIDKAANSLYGRMKSVFGNLLK